MYEGHEWGQPRPVQLWPLNPGALHEVHPSTKTGEDAGDIALHADSVHTSSMAHGGHISTCVVGKEDSLTSDVWMVAS